MNMQELKDTLIQKSTKDTAFRKSLLENPVQVIESISQRKLKDTVKVSVVEDSVDEITIVLPPQPSDELTDDELDNVSGGGILNFIFS